MDNKWRGKVSRVWKRVYVGVDLAEYVYISRSKCLLHCPAKSGAVIIICWYSIDDKKKKKKKIYIIDQNGVRFEEET